MSLLKTLQGQKTDRVPFWFMRQAGRYLPEYRELRAKQGGFLNMVYNPEAACEITMQPIRRFGMNAAILFSDILVVPQAMGQHLEFVAGEGPKLEPVRDEKQLVALKADEAVLSPIYETVSNVRAAIKDEGFDDTALIGFAGSPWTVACYMVEGQGSKDFMNAKIAAYRDTEFFTHLIDRIVEETARYLILQVKAGAQALQLFDSWAGALDADQFERWVIDPTRRIVDLVHATHPDIPIIGFPRQGGVAVKDYAQKTGVTAVALDSSMPLDWARDHVQTHLPVQGNLDPFCLFAGGDQMRDAAQNILKTLGHGPFIFNLGHGINKDTPIAHVEELVQIIKDFEKP